MKLKTRRPTFIIAFFILVLFQTIFGCERVPHSTSTVLTIWSNPSIGEEQSFLELCRKFEREHSGIKVNNLGGVEVTKLTRAVVAGDPPDACYLYNVTSVGPLAANGALLRLDDQFYRSGFRETDFLAGAIEQGRYRGKLFAMPVTRDSRGLYWNRKAFAEIGRNQDEGPQTLEELRKLALKLTVRHADGSLKRAGMLQSEDNSVNFALFGGRFYDANTGRITLNTPENLVALKWWVKLLDDMGGAEKVESLRNAMGNEYTQDPIATGLAAMMIDGEYAAMHMEKYKKFTDYGVGRLPHPAARPDLANIAWQDGDVIFIPAGAKHPTEAWEFIRWLNQPAQQEEYAAAMYNLPTLKSLKDSPKISSGSRTREAVGFMMREIAATSNNPRVFPCLPVTQLYHDELDTAFQLAARHEKSPERALADAEKRIQRELDRYVR